MTWPSQPILPLGVTAQQLADTVRGRTGGVVEQVLGPPPEVASQMAAELEQWWHDRAAEEIERTVPKAIEYGATDLVDLGRDLARLAGREVDQEEAAELGIYFYLRGKLSRWADAIMRGDRVSDDTLFDIGVYCRMVQRVRSHGGWPGVKEEAK
jgi:hypothetical protein